MTFGTTPKSLALITRLRWQLFSIALATLFTGIASAATIVLNPYADVDWNVVGQHKANLHTHTTQSDGLLTPTTAIDEYKTRGYTILALTDHNLCTWPWTTLGTMDRKGRAYQADRTAARATGDSEADKADENAEEEDEERLPKRVPPVPVYENRDPAILGMLAVSGNEISRHDHMGVYFIQYETRSRTLEQTLLEAGEAGGLAILNHPGRYWKPAEDHSVPTDVVERYVNLFKTYKHLAGVEVINQGMRYKMDIPLWDKMLESTMPDRPVWAYAGDDMHHPATLGRDWNVFLLATLDEEHLREAMVSGKSYFSSTGTQENNLRNVEQTPVIQSIVNDETTGTLAITARSGGQPLPDSQIKWISMGRVVHTGSTLNYKGAADLGNYVRAELSGEGGTTFTNPFGLKAD